MPRWGASKCLAEALLMSTHNICFCREIRKLLSWYPLLSRPMWGVWVVNTPNFRSGVLVRIQLRHILTHDCTVLHCTKPFIISLPSSKYDFNDVERGVKHQTTTNIVHCFETGDAEPRDVAADDGEPFCTTNDVKSWCHETAYDVKPTNERTHGGTEFVNI